MHFGAKILIFVVIINTMFLIGGVSDIGSSMISGMFSIQKDNNSNFYVTGIKGDLNESIPQSGVGGSFETGSTDLNFFDGLKTIGAFIFGFLLSTILAPINIIIGLGATGMLSLLFGIPLTIAYIFGIVLIIRGIS